MDDFFANIDARRLSDEDLVSLLKDSDPRLASHIKVMKNLIKSQNAILAGYRQQSFSKRDWEDRMHNNGFADDDRDR